MKNSHPSRRELLGCGACLIAMAACGTAAQKDTASQQEDTAVSGQDSNVFDPCAAEAQPDWLQLSLSDYPELEEVGGSVLTTVSGQSIIIAQVKEDCFVAVSSACTHEGEQLNYQTIGNRFTCPRHAATFGLDGSVIAGPTPVPLNSYPVALDSGSLWIKMD